jgi:hypothetical protein
MHLCVYFIPRGASPQTDARITTNGNQVAISIIIELDVPNRLALMALIPMSHLSGDRVAFTLIVRIIIVEKGISRYLPEGNVAITASAKDGARLLPLLV